MEVEEVFVVLIGGCEELLEKVGAYSNGVVFCALRSSE